MSDELAGAGGVGYSWFRLEVVSDYVAPPFIGIAEIIFGKEQVADAFALHSHNARTNITKVVIAEIRYRNLRAKNFITKIKYAFYWIKKS